MPSPRTTDTELHLARQAYERHAWGEAYRRLTEADRTGALDARDLERLAITAYLTGRPGESDEVGARAHLRAIHDGDLELAIGTAISLGMSLMERGETAQAGGWLARAERLIAEHAYDGVERGRLLIPEAVRTLMSGDAAAAFALFEQVAAIAERFGDDDLATMGRLGRGQSLIAQSETERGVRLLDEAMTAVIAGEISPIESGIVYCAVIEACRHLFDLRRAQEWTTALTRWLEAQPDLVPFRGNCLVYRAVLMRIQGAWADATTEANRARDWLSRPPPEPGVGEAIYELAELDRLRGRVDAAQIGYREAGTWGRLPEPGHALLRLALGDVAAAAMAIRRARAETSDESVRAGFLEPAVEIALAADDVGAARASADELAAFAARVGAPLIRAMALRADGAVRLAEGDVDGALLVLRQAWEEWSSLDAPYDAARVRVLTARACRAIGDTDGARLEADAAREVFLRLGAAPDLARLDDEDGDRVRAARLPAGLSAREAEVLRLVAAGLTNRAIADALTISERTVDRHVSNVYTKLDVSTRAAATAFAYEHGLV